ncbi:uncharacterized protein DS421_8g242640 [Arachis hypogaea]|nr:uncharacterized protein DS421_8g242640 [Arachis hypogaea]
MPKGSTKKPLMEQQQRILWKKMVADNITVAGTITEEMILENAMEDGEGLDGAATEMLIEGT